MDDNDNDNYNNDDTTDYPFAHTHGVTSYKLAVILTDQVQLWLHK